ncbi:FAD binding domain-containing protein [Chloroflexota bacterium]
MHFEYLEPLTIGEAVSLLAEHGDKAKVLAGGTDLVVQIKERKIIPEYVISVGRTADLNHISFDEENGLRIGALTPIDEIERSSLLQSRYGIIRQAAGQLADVTVRNMATIGGNLCNASPSADMAPSLIALSAKVKLVGAGGERSVSLEDFFTGPSATVINSGELMTEIQAATPADHTSGIYKKYSPRGAVDLATVGVAVVLTLDLGNGACNDAKVVLGAVAPTPMRAHGAEDILVGKQIDEKLIEKAAQAASAEAKPIDDIRSSAEYRKEMVKVLTADAIKLVVEQAKSQLTLPGTG